MHRPFRWFKNRIRGLLSIPESLLRAHFESEREEHQPEGDVL